jgi:hypothetical protein
MYRTEIAEEAARLGRSYESAYFDVLTHELNHVTLWTDVLRSTYASGDRALLYSFYLYDWDEVLIRAGGILLVV